MCFAHEAFVVLSGVAVFARWRCRIRLRSSAEWQDASRLFAKVRCLVVDTVLNSNDDSWSLRRNVCVEVWTRQSVFEGVALLTHR